MDILEGVQGFTITIVMVGIILLSFALQAIAAIQCEKLNMILCIRLPAALISLIAVHGAYLTKANLSYGKPIMLISIISLIIFSIIEYKHKT